MAERLRFLPVGTDAVLVELDTLDATLTLYDHLLAGRLEGVVELVPAARTVMVRFDPLATDLTELADAISMIDLSVRSLRAGEDFEIPVVYDGEDLEDVAALLGCPVAEVIRRHSEAIFTVAFAGFTPGYAYMISNDPAFNVPRRRVPRIRVPAGSVCVAGSYCGIYPSDSPGGWQLLGTTPLRMWDITRARAALLAPGDRVRFRAVSPDSIVVAAVPSVTAEKHARGSGGPRGGLLVTRADRPALYQDPGRHGQAHQGVSRSGAADRGSLRAANDCVGNPPDAAALEITFGGFALRADRAATIAVTGASGPLTISTPGGERIDALPNRPIALDRGDEFIVGVPEAGMRSYLALRGGFAVLPVLGSASTDTLARVGPAPVVAGDVLVAADGPTTSVVADMPAPPSLPRADEIVTLDVILGPRTDWYTQAGLGTFLSQQWHVTAEASRVGLRLAGKVALERRDDTELPSEGTVRGAIQVPHSGQPILFLADYPLTGGYPVIAVVAGHHLDLAAQIPIGARLRFKPVVPFVPLIRNSSR